MVFRTNRDSRHDFSSLPVPQHHSGDRTGDSLSVRSSDTIVQSTNKTSTDATAINSFDMMSETEDKELNDDFYLIYEWDK